MTVLGEFRTDGSVAVITGGASGIGRAFATAMAEAGADVVVADIDEESAGTVADDLESETEADAIPLPVDVTDESEVEALFEETVDRFGRVDAVFANAGIAEAEGPADTYDTSQWDRILDVNLRGVWLTNLYAARAMADQESGGSIVNTASVYGLRGSEPLGYNPAYTAAKGGVVNLTRTLGAEWAGDGIRVNAIAPSHAETNIGGGALDTDTEAFASVHEAIEARTPIGRIADPAETKGLALFLASEASGYCTGYT